MELDWKPISEPPPDGQIVETRVNDGEVIQLLLHRTLWWKPDHSVMAVAIPTHWRPVVQTVNLGDFNAVMPLLSVPEHGTIVVAGAYKGDYLHYFSERFPTANLHGYEPQGDAYLHTLGRLNGRAHIYNTGLGTARRHIFAGKCGSDGCSIHASEGDRRMIETVDAVQALQHLGPISGEFSPRIDLLLLNCEGSEWSLLPYLMDEMMHHKIASMAIQFHPEYVSPQRAERVLALIDEYYQRVRFDYPHWAYFLRKGI